MMKPDVPKGSHYDRRYDLLTIEYSRHIEEKFKGSVFKYKEKKISKEQFLAERLATQLVLYFKSGDDYLNKERTIGEWMERDKSLDQFLESSREPGDVRCPSCGVSMNATDKDIYRRSEGNPRVLFFLDCPSCHKKRGVFDNGEEYKPKPHICHKCGREMRHEVKRNLNIVNFKDICILCGFIAEDEIDLAVKEGDGEDDAAFIRDRKRFCMSKDAGEKFRSNLVGFENLKYITDKWEQEDKNKELYDRVGKLRKLPVSEVEKLLSGLLTKKGYTKLVLSPPDFQKQVVVGFTVQDCLSRPEFDSRNGLRRLINEVLIGTNWSLMSEGIDYRLGYLSGRIKGYESEDDLLDLVK